MIFADFLRALGQLGDARFLRVVGIGLALAVALLFAAYALLLGFVDSVTNEPLTLPIVGPVTWVGDLLAWGSLFFMVVLSVFLMIPVASAITAFYLDDVADAVEDRFYPHLPPARRATLFQGFVETVNHLGVLVLANILALVVYTFLPVSIPFLFVALNGWLLGREYFLLVAGRRLPTAEVRALMRNNRGRVWVAGMLMTLPLMLPLVSLVIPVLGAATFTHFFHRLTGARA